MSNQNHEPHLKRAFEVLFGPTGVNVTSQSEGERCVHGSKRLSIDPEYADLGARIKTYLDSPVDLWDYSDEDRDDNHRRAIALLKDAERALKTTFQAKDD